MSHVFIYLIALTMLKTIIFIYLFNPLPGIYLNPTTYQAGTLPMASINRPRWCSG